MIKEFKSGHWYKWKHPGMKDTKTTWNGDGNMDFILDGKPHKCDIGNGCRASFFDSPSPQYTWIWEDLSYFEETTNKIKSWKDHLTN